MNVSISGSRRRIEGGLEPTDEMNLDRSQTTGVGNRWAALSAAAAGLTLGVALLVSALGHGCGAAGVRACEADSDCRDDEVCAEDRCARTCSDDEVCNPGDTCQAYYDETDDEEYQVCLPPDPGGSDTSEGQCETDRDCRDRIDSGPGEEPFCNDFGQCVIGRVQHAIEIVDTTPAESETDDGDGAEIAAVFVIDGPNELVGFGQTSFYEPAPEDPSGEETGSDAGELDASEADAGTDTGDTGDTGDASSGDANDGETIEYRSTIDGARPSLDQDHQCIDGEIDETTPLGGNPGRMGVHFVDPDGERMLLEESHSVIVIEWGENCDPDDTEDDSFEVSFCRTTRGDIDFDQDCEFRTNQGRGAIATGPPEEF